jgi:gamma-glutamylcyclotransferase (GGCT)/AIG2-like uncharacterized protein YtfP
MSHHVFVYGTLLYDEVVLGLTGTIIPSVDATLPHYRRLNVHQPGRDAKGPAIVPSVGDCTTGRILLDVNDRCLQILDLLELDGGGYERVTVDAIADSNTTLSVQVYRATEAFRKHLFGDWSIDDFQRQYLAYYLTDRIPTLVAKWRAEGKYPD